MPKPRTSIRTLRRIILASLAIFLLAAIGLVGYGYSRVVASLPQMSGEAAFDGLTAPVEVTFDAQGVPTITAATLADAIAAQGFLDAQERFFQMDLARRYPAGELAELFGKRALASDKRQRAYRFRAVAEEVLPNLPGPQRALIEAYARGVNEGLSAMGDVPPEYLVLRATPEPWLAEDTILIMHGLAIGLAQDAGYERLVAVMDDALAPELVAFLTPATDRDDAPILNDNANDPTGGYVPRPIPGPDVVDLRGDPQTTGPDETAVGEAGLSPLASNNWAIAGAHTEHGGAIMANDPHLWHSVPNVWRRVRLIWPGGDAVGVNTPGFPGVVIGTNERVAWGFTNTTGDFQDYVLIDTDPDDETRYQSTPYVTAAFGSIVETIRVKGAPDEELTIRTTTWGNVVGEDHAGNPLALKWAALDPESQNCNLLDLLTARSLEEAFDSMRTFQGPSQNAVLADDRGRIAWVVTGYLPRRRGFTGKAPVSWVSPGTGWAGELPDSARPQMFDPPGGMIVTANNRTMDLDRSEPIGRAWARPGRAGRIIERLNEEPSSTERTMLDLQLDTLAPRHERWRTIIEDAMTDGASTDELSRAMEILAAWDGTASADQPGYRILERFRRLLRREMITPLVAPCLEIDPGFVYRWINSDEPMWRLLDERPVHLLAPRHASWDALIRDTFAEAVTQCAGDGGIDRPWGDANRADITHPLSGAIPGIGALLDMPADQLDGASGVVRVATPGFGASLRLVVSPGRLGDAIFHMPCGQSGHPLSEHYRAGHSDWLDGEPSPLLPGETVSTLRLLPAERQP